MIVSVLLKSRQSQLRTAFLFVIGLMTVWSAGTVLELDFRAVTGITNIAFINICYIGICLVPVALLYLGKVIMTPEWKLRSVHAVFLIIPVISIIVVITNPLHHLFFVRFSLLSSEAVYGGYYYFHSVYSYGCIAAAVVLMLIASYRNSGLFSIQSLLVIAGVLVAAVPNIMYSFGAADLPFSISTAAFTATVLCLLIAFFKFRFITDLPITLRQVVDLISDGYLVTDREHRILSYNRALVHLFPHPVEITPGENIRRFIDQNFIDASYDQYVEFQTLAAAEHRTITTELRITEDIYVSTEITPVFQHNMLTGNIILIKDITQSKKLIEVTKTESRYKSEFLSNMSHEIRTPMNAIIGMVNIGKSAPDMERKNYCLSRIDEASRHLLGLINNILDISKIEAGKFELSSEEFIFEKMLQQIVNVVKFRADEKNQTLSIRIDKAIPENLVGDDQRLAQVITNLIGNAVKFTPEHGWIRLNTTLLEAKEAVCTIQFDVIDSGIGISAEQQARLFQSYTQAETNTSRKYGGTGLGLTISKNIVEMMGGRIWIESQPGKGSIFSFTVHLAKGAEEKRNLLSLNLIPEGLRILAVDIDPDFLDYFNDISGRIGIACDTAGTCEEALDLVNKKGAYNIYFIDREMGSDHGGIELIRELKSRPKAEPKSVIVLFSGVDWSEIAGEAKAAGVDKFIQKPVFPSAIMDILSEYLGASKEHAEETSIDTDLFAGSRILLAEDVDVNREIVMAMLEPTGLKIECAANGLEAVRMFSQAPDSYDLIFMDVQMPEMDGCEATRRIREIEAQPEYQNRRQSGQIPIIAMTASVFREDIEKCLAAGMNGHIGKPLDYGEVIRQLKIYCCVKSA